MGIGLQNVHENYWLAMNIHIRFIRIRKVNFFKKLNMTNLK